MSRAAAASLARGPALEFAWEERAKKASVQLLAVVVGGVRSGARARARVRVCCVRAYVFKCVFARARSRACVPAGLRASMCVHARSCVRVTGVV